MLAAAFLAGLAAICSAVALPGAITRREISKASIESPTTLSPGAIKFMSPSNRTRSTLDRRDDDPYWPYSHCGCNYTLNHKDTDEAVKGLTEQLKSRPRFAGTSIYAISGTTVAFLCRWKSTNTEQLTLGIVKPLLPIINDRCGPYVAGSVAGTFPNKDAGAGYGFWLGYMRFYPGTGVDFCKAASLSKDRTCSTGLQSTSHSSS
ncbi:FluG domain-containing protein [Purpureocillium lavendulum]|uniref:FluG domain-containing protein n=1 Tax=Purpureocillium lavendulum TaxID=1247861 RepID=A0AB34FGH0_9HYPO|nr:FluG domain-containing protein [Purpureocillium lavendulum]